MEGGNTIGFISAYACWVKGVRIVDPNLGTTVAISRSDHNLFTNNYIVSTYDGGNDNEIFNISTNSGEQGESDFLVLNNIIQGGFIEGGGDYEGDVLAYNYVRDSQNTYPETEFEHQAGTAFFLREGNQMANSWDDNTWGTKDLNTWFRNYYSCRDADYVGGDNFSALQVGNFNRFENIIGNALGSSSCTTSYTGSAWPVIYYMPGGNALTLASLMRWGNYDTVTGAVRWCGNSSNPGWPTTCGSTSEVPTTLSGNAAPFANPIPSSTSLPASFFMNNMTAHPSGGTGLSWWKVCTGWTMFPTSCATSATQPFPPIGPDITGGNNINGYAYDIPAALAFKNLPIDTTYQRSYTVTGSSWSAGKETLTVSLPSSEHVMGGFQLTGAPTACNPSAAELFMTGSTSTTISYALSSNPGTSCSGTVMWPDVRQFDERVYQADQANVGTAPASPTNLTVTVH